MADKNVRLKSGNDVLYPQTKVGNILNDDGSKFERYINIGKYLVNNTHISQEGFDYLLKLKDNKNFIGINYLGYNYGQTTGFNYPDYFSYYIMNIDDETKELSYLPISKTEAKTRGESGEYIFVKAYTPTDIESLINKKIKTFKTSSELQNIID